MLPSVGLPHSEILGSKRVCRSPKLIAAYRVLHRLRVPRHPPSAFTRLTTTTVKQSTRDLQRMNSDVAPEGAASAIHYSEIHFPTNTSRSIVKQRVLRSLPREAAGTAMKIER